VCDDPPSFGHAYEVRNSTGERVLVCEALECSRDLRRAAPDPGPTRVQLYRGKVVGEERDADASAKNTRR
jgi:hypothetical protein